MLTSKDRRCSKGRQCLGDVCPDGGAFVDTTVIDRCRSVSTCGTDGKNEKLLLSG